MMDVPCGAQLTDQAEPTFEGDAARTIVVVRQRRTRYYVAMAHPHNPPQSHAYQFAGNTPYDAAVMAADKMMQYARYNPNGGDLMAPADVLELIPLQLHHVTAWGPTPEPANATQDG